MTTSGLRVLLLATTTGYQTRAFEEAAERLGAGLVYATDRCDQIENPWQDGAIPIRFHEEERSVRAIVDRARQRPVHGLVVVGDRPTLIGARAAEALGLPWHPPFAVAAARNKQRTRERLRDAGLLVPWFVGVPVRSAARELASSVSFPCVVKPVALSGSRGVMRADDQLSFIAALERLQALLDATDIRAERDRAHQSILIEEFIPGREYAVEGLLHDGALHPLAIFDKPDPLDGPFFEETIYVTPSRAPASVQRAIVEATREAARALGLRHGPIHAECRTNGRGVFILEVAARPIGGLCARTLTFDGRRLEEMLLRHALGEEPAGWRRDPDASGVMMIPIPRRGMLRGISGIEEANEVPHVTDVRVTAKIDQLLVPLPEGASYLGFIFARATAPADVERALRSAHDLLTFRIDPELPVLPGGRIHYNHAHG